MPKAKSNKTKEQIDQERKYNLILARMALAAKVDARGGPKPKKPKSNKTKEQLDQERKHSLILARMALAAKVDARGGPKPKKAKLTKEERSAAAKRGAITRKNNAAMRKFAEIDY